MTTTTDDAVVPKPDPKSKIAADKSKEAAEILEALKSKGGASLPGVELDGAQPEIILPNQEEIASSPLHIVWTHGDAKVSKWWLSVGHEPRLDDYCGEDYYNPDASFFLEAVPVPMTGGDVFILIEYQRADGTYGEIRMDCQTKDTTEKPCHDHHRNDETEESHH